MVSISEKHHRSNIRLKDYDYSKAGIYFITICTKNLKCIFGDVVKGKMRLNEHGKILNKFWHKIPDHFAKAESDMLSVMPNHIHGTIMITDECRGGVTPPKSRDEETSPLQKRSLGQIVAYFKYQTTRSINQIRKTHGIPVWQRNYYDHIIRNGKELNQVRKYIMENPLKWELDKENPNNLLKHKDAK